MLEVVDRAALYLELFAAALAAHLGHGDEFPAGEILTGDGIALQQLVHRALKYDLAAVAARARADVHDMIGREHGVLVMLDHDQRVAEVAQTLKGREQLVVVDGSSRIYSTPTSDEPICVARRMRWLSPPDSVPDERESVRYSRPTD